MGPPGGGVPRSYRRPALLPRKIAATPPGGHPGPSARTVAPEGRKRVAHGANRGTRGAQHKPRRGDRENGRDSVAPPGLGGRGRRTTRLTPWATLFRPSRANVRRRWTPESAPTPAV